MELILYVFCKIHHADIWAWGFHDVKLELLIQSFNLLLVYLKFLFLEAISEVCVSVFLLYFNLSNLLVYNC